MHAASAARLGLHRLARPARRFLRLSNSRGAGSTRLSQARECVRAHPSSAAPRARSRDPWLDARSTHNALRAPGARVRTSKAHLAKERARQQHPPQRGTPHHCRRSFAVGGGAKAEAGPGQRRVACCRTADTWRVSPRVGVACSESRLRGASGRRQSPRQQTDRRPDRRQPSPSSSGPRSCSTPRPRSPAGAHTLRCTRARRARHERSEPRCAAATRTRPTAPLAQLDSRTTVAAAVSLGLGEVLAPAAYPRVLVDAPKMATGRGGCAPRFGEHARRP